MTVELNDGQVALLRNVLTNYLSDLRMEIADTENYELRQELKHNEALLVDILAKLGENIQFGEDLRRIA